MVRMAVAVKAIGKKKEQQAEDCQLDAQPVWENFREKARKKEENSTDKKRQADASDQLQPVPLPEPPGFAGMYGLHKITPCLRRR